MEFLLDEASTKTTSNNTRSTGTTGTGIGATANIISESESELKVKRESSIANIINPQQQQLPQQLIRITITLHHLLKLENILKIQQENFLVINVPCHFVDHQI